MTKLILTMTYLKMHATIYKETLSVTYTLIISKSVMAFNIDKDILELEVDCFTCKEQASEVL